MFRQKSYENGQPTLFLVPTPIGNLSEMTPRAIEVLQSVDVIACEDTRTSGQLLKHFEISNKKLIAYQKFNEDPSAKGIIKLLEQGKNVALISDAGYPLINDPGQRVVSEASSQGYNVVPVSGCNAMLNALVASGLVVQPFIFIGFLPQGDSERRKKLREYQNYPMTMVFYESPHRIEKMMKDCLNIFGDRQCCIARELTKLHEEFLRGSVSEMLEIMDTIKGEMVVVMGGNKNDPVEAITDDTIVSMVNELIESGTSKSQAIKEIAKKTGVSKNKVYDLVLNQE